MTYTPLPPEGSPDQLGVLLAGAVSTPRRRRRSPRRSCESPRRRSRGSGPPDRLNGIRDHSRPVGPASRRASPFPPGRVLSGRPAGVEQDAVGGVAIVGRGSRVLGGLDLDRLYHRHAQAAADMVTRSGGSSPCNWIRSAAPRRQQRRAGHRRDRPSGQRPWPGRAPCRRGASPPRAEVARARRKEDETDVIRAASQRRFQRRIGFQPADLDLDRHGCRSFVAEVSGAADGFVQFTMRGNICAAEPCPRDAAVACILGSSRSTPRVVALERRLTARAGCRPTVGYAPHGNGAPHTARAEMPRCL